MKALFVSVLVVFSLLAAAPSSWASQRPRLVVVVAIDQFRPDFLERFDDDFLPAWEKGKAGGFKLLLEEGASYLDAAYSHLPTFTCPGHATILTGAWPGVSGIIGNRWFDRESGREVGCVDALGSSETGQRSPRNLLVSTLGDELELATNESARVVGLGGKDYAVMTLVGRMADLALWFDRGQGHWVSSPHYTALESLPDWVGELNAKGPAERFRGLVWTPLNPDAVFRYSNPEPVWEGVQEEPYGYGWRFPHPLGGDSPQDSEYFRRLIASPFGNELILDAARLAVGAEQLGQDDTPDILALSLSSNDYVGHAFGPSSPEVADTILRTDRQLAGFFQFLIEAVGREHLVVVLTSDHGVQYIPREIQARGGSAGRVFPDGLESRVEEALVGRFGPGDWVLAVLDLEFYLNHDLIEERQLEPSRVEWVAAEAAMGDPGIRQAYTRSQILSGQLPPTEIGSRVANSFHPRRSGDVVLIYESNWFMDEEVVTTHGTHYPPNTMVPVLLWGDGIPRGRHWRRIDVRDIAPTLSHLLGVGYPSGCSGQPLVEVLEGRP